MAVGRGGDLPGALRTSRAGKFSDSNTGDGCETKTGAAIKLSPALHLIGPGEDGDVEAVSPPGLPDPYAATVWLDRVLRQGMPPAYHQAGENIRRKPCGMS